MAKAIDNIRSEIDSIDRQIQDLLMKSAAPVQHIRAEKRKNKVQIIQPHREAVLIRRLLDRHQGNLPKEAVVRIWRELTGAVSLLQTNLKVAVTVPEDQVGLQYWDLAKDYFSSVIPLQRVGDPLAALSQVREGDATFAVLPWPEDRIRNPWWHFLMGDSSEGALQILMRLPFGDRNAHEPNPPFRALVVGRMPFHSSGTDRSFLALTLGQGVSRGRLVEKAENLNMKVRSQYITASHDGQHNIHLLEVEEFIDRGDKRLDKLADMMKAADKRCYILGGYPEPPVYEDKLGKNAISGGADQNFKRHSY